MPPPAPSSSGTSRTASCCWKLFRDDDDEAVLPRQNHSVNPGRFWGGSCFGRVRRGILTTLLVLVHWKHSTTYSVFSKNVAVCLGARLRLSGQSGSTVRRTWLQEERVGTVADSSSFAADSRLAGLPHKPKPRGLQLLAAMVEKGKSRTSEVVTREYTINLHKRLHSV
jgi:hypothetical protein